MIFSRLSYQYETKVPIKTYKDLVFKKNCSETIRNWINFCGYHHNYTYEKLLEVFPEYLVIS